MKINYLTLYKIKQSKDENGKFRLEEMSAMSCHPIYMFADKGCSDLYYEINMPQILENVKGYARKVFDCKFQEDDEQNFDSLVVAEERPFQYHNLPNK